MRTLFYPALVALAAAAPAHARSDKAQWGNSAQWNTTPQRSAENRSADLLKAGGDHLVTVNVPYQLSALDPDVEKIGIVCQLNYTVPGAHGHSSSAHSEHEVDVTPIAGAASGIATVTWDRGDLDPAADLTHGVGANRCNLILYVRGAGAITLSEHTTNSGEPAASPQPGADYRPEESFSLSS